MEHDFTMKRNEEQDLPPEKLLEILLRMYSEESAIRMFNELVRDEDEN